MARVANMIGAVENSNVDGKALKRLTLLSFGGFRRRTWDAPFLFTEDNLIKMPPDANEVGDKRPNHNFLLRGVFQFCSN